METRIHAAKKPVPGSRGFNDATTDEAQIRAWWAQNPNYNIAFVPGVLGWSIVDLDQGEIGRASWAALQEQYGPAPETYEVATPRGGQHLYFEGALPPSVGRVGKAIDIRGDASYALLPPSMCGGKPYRRLNDRDIAPAPTWLPALAAPRTTASKAATSEQDLPHNVDAAIRWLEARPEVHQGDGADEATFKAAAMLSDMGLSAEKSIEIMLAHYKCWPQDERYEAFITRKVENAAGYKQNEAGAYASPLTMADVAAPYILAPVAPRDALEADAGMADFGEIIQREVRPTPFLWPGWVQKGTTTLHAGRGEALKSYSLLQDGICIHTGTPIEGTPVERATFVYFSGEDPIEEVIIRARAICRRLKIEPATLAGAKFRDVTAFDGAFYEIADDGTVTATAFHDRVRAELLAIPGHKFVALDSCYNFLKFRGSSKIDEGAVKDCADRLNRLCVELDASIQLLWHPSQAGQDRGDNSGWSVAWHNAFRCRIGYTPDKNNPGAVTRCVEKRNHGSKPEPVVIHWHDGAILVLGAGDDAAPRKTRLGNACVEVAIMAAEHCAPIQKRQHPAGWIVGEIERLCGWRPAPREIKDALATAMYEGRLRYLEGNKDRVAGYYPEAQEVAAELAYAAKRHGQGGGQSRVGLPPTTPN
jgi:hypothetical protein